MKTLPERQLEAMREKVRTLEEYCEATKHNEELNQQAREDILLTTKRLINQFKEDIIRLELQMRVPVEFK